MQKADVGLPFTATEGDVLATPGAAALYKRLQENRDTVGLVELVPALAGPTDRETRHFTTVRRRDEIQRLATSLNNRVIAMGEHMERIDEHLQQLQDSAVLRDKAPVVLRVYLIDRQRAARLRHYGNRARWRELWWKFLKEAKKINPSYTMVTRANRPPALITTLPYVPSLTEPGRRPRSKPMSGWSTGGFSISEKDPFAVL